MVGAIVRLTGSGSGCGSEWPFCNGQFVPTSTGTSTVFDFSHRLLSLLVSLLVVGLVVEVWHWRKSKPLLFWGSIISLLLVVAQIVLGAVTAVTSATPAIEVAHLGLAQVFLGRCSSSRLSRSLPGSRRSRDVPFGQLGPASAGRR